jgi:hypothetical protein
MQAIKIKEAINQIGNIDINFNERESIFLMDGTDIIYLNESTFDLLKNDFIDKLNTYFNNGGSVNLIKDLLNSIVLLLENLLREYHLNRVKLAHLSDSDFRFIEGYKKIIHLITLKMNLLEGIGTELKLIVENFNFKTNSDFNLNITSNDSISDYNLQTTLNSKDDNLREEKENPYSNIFMNYDAFLFFERLKENICTEHGTQLADYSYVYRKMLADKYINYEVSPSSFVAFLDKNYNIILDPLKSWGKLTGKHREKLYDILKTKSS